MYAAGTTTSADRPRSSDPRGAPFDGSYNPCCADAFVAVLEEVGGHVFQLTYLEIYDGGGEKVAQSAIGGQSFAAGEARASTWSYLAPATPPAGAYTVKIGVFSGDWSTLYTWDNQAATFVVQ